MCAAQRLFNVMGFNVVAGKQRGGHVAGAVALKRQQRGREQESALTINGQHLDLICRGFRALYEVTNTVFGPISCAFFTAAKVSSKVLTSVSVR